jgi:hypothetical protein
VTTTDGPYAETKEQLGGILVLEARDMNHAVQLIGQHPALAYGNIFEISASRGHERNHEGKRAAAETEHCALKTILLCHRRNRAGRGAPDLFQAGPEGSNRNSLAVATSEYAP